MLELCALGLLQREPVHGYRLKQDLELFMSSCLSVNYGAIYPLLHRLEERGYIESSIEESPESGSSRKIYSVTPEGQARWQTLMAQQPRDSWVNSRSRFIVKFFFFSDIDPQLRLKLLKARIRACEERQDLVYGQDFGSDAYQQAAWERHLQMLMGELHWLHDQLDQEQGQQSPETQESYSNHAIH
ncbi:MAG: PadR family transcriptional regulator [Phormidium sp. BM_Day4_Bin.17]|nr:PadR family transcriptional regulator [Phormidium sp. BM_Day4_Bin.17]UCJ14521.1 MAG: PadR family transcriptional regulator [Phormidium sp. PBR-2020]